jgi:peptidoglycan hydrolase-like protein with peptidoglycan-binding domain
MTLPTLSTLKLGDSGPDVEFVQSILGLPVDGYFDSSTEAAVQAFQKTFALPAGGIVDQDTWVSLMILKDNQRTHLTSPHEKDNSHVA